MRGRIPSERRWRRCARRATRHTVRSKLCLSRRRRNSFPEKRWSFDRAGEVLAPGSRDDPVQFIEARDLAEWTIRMVEKRETGVYNATGPAEPLGIGGMLDRIKDALKSEAKFTW